MRRRILAGLVAVIGAAGLAVTAHASLDAFALTGAPAASTSANTAGAPTYACSIQAYLSGQCPVPPRLCIHGPCPDGTAPSATTATAAAPAAPTITCVNSPLIPVDPCRVICPHCTADTAASAATATAAAPASSPAYVCTLQGMLDGTCKPAVCSGHVCPMVDLAPTPATATAAAPPTTVRLGR